MNNKEIVRNFKETLKLDNKSKNTIKSYGRILNQLEEVINKNFSQLNMLDINKFKSYMNNKDYSHSTISLYLMCIRSFIKFMHEYEIIENDFSGNIKTPKKPKTVEEKKYMSMDEQLKLIKHLNQLNNNKTNQTHRLVLILILTTGARKSEIAKLKPADIDFENDIILLNGKGEKQRYASLYQPIKEDLKKYIEKYSTENLIFTYGGKQMSHTTINGMLEKHLELAGLDTDYSPHDLRHACASAMFNNGASLEEVKMALGHESISTTEKVYVHFNKERQMSGFNKNPLFNKKGE
jgi:integrase/recombinase XerC